MRISLRLSLGFGLLALIVLVLGLFSISKMDAMNDKTEEIVSKWVPSMDAIGSLNLIEPGLAVDLYHLLKAGVELSINNNGVAYKGVITGVKGGIPFTQIRVKITP